VFLAFLGQSSSKTPQNNTEKIFDPDPVTFLAPDLPTCHHGGLRFFGGRLLFAGPLPLALWDQEAQSPDSRAQELEVQQFLVQV
jgi:hypothetical protein